MRWTQRNRVSHALAACVTGKKSEIEKMDCVAQIIGTEMKGDVLWNPNIRQTLAFSAHTLEHQNKIKNTNNKTHEDIFEQLLDFSRQQKSAFANITS